MESKLEKNLDIFRNHIKEKKHQKFLRDYNDFKEDIFRTKKQPRRHFNRRPNSLTRYTDGSDSDSSYTTSRRGSRSSSRSQQQGTKGILRRQEKSVSFLETPLPPAPTTSMTLIAFLDQDWPTPQRGSLSNRGKWGYKPEVVNNRQ
ncbi:Hypothetical predicted protein [Pelobates cultripes]|nr:Hypothetical predicted protein [Pelobates cultripes]